MNICITPEIFNEVMQNIKAMIQQNAEIQSIIDFIDSKTKEYCE